MNKQKVGMDLLVKILDSIPNTDSMYQKGSLYTYNSGGILLHGYLSDGDIVRYDGRGFRILLDDGSEIPPDEGCSGGQLCVTIIKGKHAGHRVGVLNGALQPTKEEKENNA